MVLNHSIVLCTAFGQIIENPIPGELLGIGILADEGWWRRDDGIREGYLSLFGPRIPQRRNG